MEEKYKYLTVLLYSISLILGGYINVDDENFRELLIGFINNFYYEKKNIFDKIFEFHMKNNNEMMVKIDYDKVIKYGNIFLTNPRKLAMVYDEIGREDINEITNLAQLFCFYCNQVDDMNNNLKRH